VLHIFSALRLSCGFLPVCEGLSGAHGWSMAAREGVAASAPRQDRHIVFGTPLSWPSGEVRPRTELVRCRARGARLAMRGCGVRVRRLQLLRAHCLQDRLQCCRGVCNPLLAVDEVDHLLALPGQRDVPVVGSGVFSIREYHAARHGGQSLPQLRAPRSVVVIHTGLHYVVAACFGARVRAAEAPDGRALPHVLGGRA
jgi:hypothetical protein